MALTLVVETGTGTDPDANTYQTVATADAYHESVMESADWAAADDPTKGKALVQAARILGSQFTWKACPASADQPLAWPLQDFIFQGRLLASGSIPRQVIEAQAEIARELISAGGFQTRSVNAGGADQLASINLGRGALELEYQEQDPEAAGDNELKTVVTPYVVQLLRGLATFKQGGDRIARVRR